MMKKNNYRSLLHTVRPERMLHMALMVLLGIIVSGDLDFFNPNDIIFIALAPASIVFVWQYTTMTNDIYDIRIDRRVHRKRPLVTGAISVKTYRRISYVFAALAVLCSFFLGIMPFMLVSACLFMGGIYSTPPFKVRKRVYSSLIIGAGSMLSFFLGAVTPDSFMLGGEWFHGLDAGTMSAAFGHDVLLIGVMIFAALSIAPLINAYEDYEGDKRTGVRNIHTVYGTETSKKILMFLIPFTFLLPLLILNEGPDILIIGCFSAAAAAVFWKLEKSSPIFALYFIVLVYSSLRYFGYLTY